MFEFNWVPGIRPLDGGALSVLPRIGTDLELWTG